MIKKRKYVAIVKRYNKERRQYFADARDENAKRNLRLLRKLSVLMIPVMLLVYCGMKLFIPRWTLSFAHILFLLVLLLFAAVSTLYAKRAEIKTSWANILCFLFYVCLLGFFIEFDVFGPPGVPATFVPLLLTMIPVAFVFRFRIMLSLMLATEIVYICLVYMIKEAEIAHSDIFTSLVGLFFGVLIAFTIVQLRIQDNNAKNEYQRRSLVDPVTGILNKFSFENTVREALKARERTTSCALMLLDIDNLKRMNDELGTMVGDMFLEDIAEYLTHTFRGSDIIGRVGADEFMIYVRDMKDEDWLTNRCSRIQHEVKALSNEHGNVNMTVSIGVVISGEDPIGFDTLYRLVDGALYKAKTHGRGKYMVRNVQSGDALEDEDIEEGI